MIVVGASLLVAIVAFAVMCFVKSQRRERKQVGMQPKQVEEEVKSFSKDEIGGGEYT